MPTGEYYHYPYNLFANGYYSNTLTSYRVVTECKCDICNEYVQNHTKFGSNFICDSCADNIVTILNKMINKNDMNKCECDIKSLMTEGCKCKIQENNI